VRMRSVRLDEMVHALDLGRSPVAKAVKRTVKTITPRSLRRKAFDTVQERVVFGSPEPPDEEVLVDVRRRLKPEVEAFSEYMQRDLLALWGYDELG
jgi:hypothetical protein